MISGFPILMNNLCYFRGELNIQLRGECIREACSRDGRKGRLLQSGAIRR